MAKIIIRKGFVSYGGRFYKAGEIVPMEDGNCARRMVARSGGDFDFYHGEDAPADDGNEAPTMGEGVNPDAAGEEDDGVSESDTTKGAGDGADSMGLPAVDADAAVQTAKPAKGKGK